uniref:hypothetical protein n=1 Tax=Listeria monocytogenes TaxID=1639 RepID=UPI001C4DEDB2
NNIALKQCKVTFKKLSGFGSIQNNIALKPVLTLDKEFVCFGSIQNNIALKLSTGRRALP